jgi:hypothetical protein
MHNTFGMLEHIVPVKAYSDIVSTATNTTHLKITGHRVAFLLSFATITGDSVTLTVEASSAATTTGAAAIPFYYRLSPVTASNDTWGAVTSADSTGFDVTASDDGKLVLIEVDPRNVIDEEDQYLSVLIAPGASASAVGVSAVAFQESRYAQYDQVSST